MKLDFRKVAATAVLIALLLSIFMYFWTGPENTNSLPQSSALAGESSTSAPLATSPHPIDEPSSLDSSPIWIIAAFLTIVAFTALILVALKKRRDDLMSSPHLVTPESFRRWTGQVEGVIANVIEATNNNSSEVRESKNSLHSAIEELARTFLTLQQALDQRDQQLRRAEQGWELHIFRKFLLRFVRVDETLSDESIDAESTLAQGRLMLRDALEECGVELFEPRIGSDYRTAKGVDDQPLLNYVDEKALFFTVMRVVSPGYRVRAENGENVIVIPAKVEIYAPKENARA